MSFASQAERAVRRVVTAAAISDDTRVSSTLRRFLGMGATSDLKRAKEARQQILAGGEKVKEALAETRGRC